MRFGQFLENITGARLSADAPSGSMLPEAIAQSRHASPSMAKSIFTSPRLSLALPYPMETEAKTYRLTADFEHPGGRIREEYESKSGSDNLDGASGDEQDAGNPPRKKRYHRHTPQQIQELEALFKECPHPDEKQRLELSKRLCLESRQVKFWFQNRRTQMKTQLERHENSILRQENDKLRAENMSIREAMRNPICSNCGGPAMLGEISLEEQHLRMENARLKNELERVCGHAAKFLVRPMSARVTSPMATPLQNSSLELAVGNNGIGCRSHLPSLMTPGIDVASRDFLAYTPLPGTRSSNVSGVEATLERSLLLEIALAAMDEFIKMAQAGCPLWLPGLGGNEALNFEEHIRAFPRCVGATPAGYVTEGTRASGVVIVNSVALVETMTDADRWAEMFPCMVARTSITDVISRGIGGTKNGSVQIMTAELQVLSPLVPMRHVNFLRFCKQHAEDMWAVVDVSIDNIRQSSAAAGRNMHCMRLPSGCLVQDMPNGYSKVTWVEHVEYNEALVHPLYRPMLRAGMGFGAQRWVAALQRQCECLAILMSSTAAPRDHAITHGGRRSMLKLAQRMTHSFCSGVCASTTQRWNKICNGNVDEDVRVTTRQSVDDPGQPPGIVLSAATSVWLPISTQRLFNFLRDETLRSEWDILSNGGPMHEMAHIARGQDPGNCVSLLRSTAQEANQPSMLILQETCTDLAGSLVVYAPVDIPAMHVVMNGGDSACVALLPSGFAVVPDGSSCCGSACGASRDCDASGSVGGSLLTVAFQILVNSLPTAKLTFESIETVNNLISCTVQKIKAALHCEC